MKRINVTYNTRIETTRNKYSFAIHMRIVQWTNSENL